MACAYTNPDSIAEVRLYLKGVAKYLTDRLYGAAGPAKGTTLSSLEKTVSSVCVTLSEEILQQALSRQSLAFSSALPDSVCCPSCQLPTQPRPPEQRVVRTDVGAADWLEPCYFCTNCRKAFFPSVGQPRP